ncbi:MULTISPECIES: tRNA lysidine(34) synthetase TilS [unclassified Mesorhizobium]|uniref:tRNA lysidine(34) synthetase TilS n=1 Tax=unclassified Mesorhizobium TaxID=325217 RepID=UPI000FCBD55D|nr:MULTISPECIES: tRNA lysidine(34) synthetase TilS [unclassified Mesorhizobium]TGP25101.1 tRNA lysidine(34) synthetase TilS [Mesorhizobium sp. M1D.F.Ca.ET.231.01.1.1]TGP36424.1 tRNA lysidine(34) synthetase TilS [Mesorhizobium sp. M1D.F.Ca.ET.234.01.1.1]TGS49928.1 tRNA lysidine(34) synthetase TilS [Mesorhizobium sp. M1D.F.Ca.ET.184.01.1.1]TGS64639.1 tRNA lysidine(34) synthetase TilS [Mesorhizobium sp. M1D.F.Ca.ET.183.01.1.1]
MLDTEPDLSDRLFSDYDFSNGAVAAVSGGSDSTALLFLLKHHLDRTLPAATLLAVTIDHDLRPGSAAEAQAVARLCAGHGIAHRTLVWSGRKPSTGLPAAAREARYRLLAEAAEAEGIRLILTGHTADDQAETVLMRQARDEGAREDDTHDGRGLAGMAPATLYNWRTWIARPLLGTRRAALREMLKRRGIGWAEDPTNVDQRFERPRLRMSLAGGDGEARAEQAITKAGQAAAEREELGRRAAALIGALASSPASGLIRLDRVFADGEDGEAAVYALRILLAAVGGVSFLVDEARCRALFERLRSGALCATLSRTVVDARRTGIFLHREARDLPAVQAADQAVWDGRRRITLSDRSDGLVIAPAGSAAASRYAPEGDVPASVLRRALAAEPALWRGGERLDFAGGGATPPAAAIIPVVSPFARFLPSFDLKPAAAVAALIGAPPLPPLPCRGHDRDGAWAKA